MRPTKTDDRLAETMMAASRAARGLVAAALADPRNMDTVCGDLSPDVLRDDWAATVYEHARLVYAANGRNGIPLDRLAVRVTATGRYGKLSDVARDLSALYQSGGAGVDAEYFMRAVSVTGKQMAAYTAGQSIIRDVMDVDTDTIEPAEMDGIIQGAMASLDAEQPGGAKDLGDVVQRTIAVVTDRHRPGRPKPIFTGIQTLDDKLVGFEQPEVVVIAGRPGNGKTVIGVNIAAWAAANGLPVLFFSLEMDDTQLGERMATGETGADALRLRAGRGTEEDFRLLRNAPGIFDGWPLYFHDRRTLTVAALIAEGKRVKRKHGLRLVVVDYLQLVRAANPKAPRWEQVAQISRDMKLAASELKVPIVCLSQLNRECENRPDGKPRMSDLRESGNVEQDADTVILLSEVPGQVADTSEKKVLFQIAKQRHGSPGEVELMFLKSRMRFDDVPPPIFGLPGEGGPAGW